jgi:hypothetical protein
MSKQHTQFGSDRGAAILIFVLFFLVASTTLVIGIGRGVYDDLVLYRALENGKQSLYAAEAGIEDAVYRHRDAKGYSNMEVFTIGGVSVTMTRTLVVDTYEILANATLNNAVRLTKVHLAVGDGASFNFGLQSGNGGITLSNNSNVYGNVFSNGTVLGQGNATVFGEIIAAGPTGKVKTIHATGTVWAHSLDGALIDGDAYYFDATTRVGTIVNGNSYPGTPDQATIDMPIPDAKIEEWKTIIETTGTVIASTSPECSSGTYVIQTDTTLNNVKIECNVDMRKQGAATTIILAGPVWIEGNLSFSQGPNIVASSSLGLKSVQVIVDNEIDRIMSGKVSINQSTNFSSGNAQSYVVLISMNNSAENGGSEMAINIAQSAIGKVLVYAPHGLIKMGNSISLKEVTGYQIDVNNGASVIYESGLMSLLFTGGPGGGFTITSWKEVE